MASLKTSLSKVLKYEGGYVDDPSDPGGETYAGVSRRYWPNWVGWAHIDGIKDKTHLDIYVPIQDAVVAFYQEHFWGRIRGDSIQIQQVADELLECAVHVGVHQAVKFVQTGLNILNRNGTNYKDLVVDGEIGNQTLYTINLYARNSLSSDVEVLIKVLNILQGAYYIEKMAESDRKERFARGWLSRV